MGMAVAPDKLTARRDRGTSAQARWDRHTGPRRDHTWRWNAASTPAARLRAAISEILAAAVAVRRTHDNDHAERVVDTAAWTLHNLAADVRARATGGAQ